MQIVFGPLALTLATPDLDARLGELQTSVDELKKELRTMANQLSAIDQELNAAVSALQSEEASEVQRYEAILALLQANPSAANTQAAITALQSITADLKSRAQTSAVSPAPPPV